MYENCNAYLMGFAETADAPLHIANPVFFLGKHRNACDRYCSACERVKELKCVCHTPDACNLESLIPATLGCCVATHHTRVGKKVLGTFSFSSNHGTSLYAVLWKLLW